MNDCESQLIAIITVRSMAALSISACIVSLSYCGYVPQFKYQIGETFGSHTHMLLTSTEDPKVASSGNPLLSETIVSQKPPPKTAEDFFNSSVYKNRIRSWGDQKYSPQMVPGYTGECVCSLNK